MPRYHQRDGIARWPNLCGLSAKKTAVATLIVRMQLFFLQCISITSMITPYSRLTKYSNRDIQKTLLIIPCYNEEKRIHLSEFARHVPKVQFVFANDGSTDCTLSIVDNFIKNYPTMFLYNSSKNVGKAQVIYQAYHFAKDKGLLEGMQWVGYWDADLATPIDELYRMLQFLAMQDQPYDAIWCSRVLRLGAKIKRSELRHVLSRIFITLTSLLLKIKVYDTQCGAKIFNLACAERAFEKPFVSKWIFDVEIYLRIKSIYNVLEYPLTHWEDIQGSKVKIYKEALRVLKDLFHMRKIY